MADSLSPGFSTMIVPLQYISASAMADILKPLADEAAFVRVDDARGLLMLAGTQQQLSGWLDIITTFDVDMLSGMSVGMFPHLFQHWLTAREAKTFRLTVIAHPIFIMIVWVPCVLLGVWAVGQGIEAPGGKVNAILGQMVKEVLDSPVLTGLITAGILAAIMSSLDSQFVCLGTIFTNDVVIHAMGRERFTDKQIMWLGRGFVVFIVIVTYLLSLLEPPNIFDLAVWCFSGFASLFPLVVAAVYWRRATAAGAIACVLVAGGTWAALFYDGLLAPTLAGERIGEDYLIWGMMPVTVMIAASTTALVVVSLLTRPPSSATVRRFFDEAGPGGR